VNTPPTHGLVETKEVSDFPKFQKWNKRYECNEKRVPGRQLLYTPEPGFSGTDQLAIDVEFPGGSKTQQKINITVK
jgi:hypothetical protein